MNKVFWRVSWLPLLLAGTFVVGEAVTPSTAQAATRGRRTLGTVTGLVQDSKGQPLAGALVTVLRDGVNIVIKQTKSAADGTFTTRLAPGRYLLRAVADGFNAASFSAVQVNSSSELVYRFNLEPAGQGRTAPERRRDRDDRKWEIRAAQSHRSIFQMKEDEGEITFPSTSTSSTSASTSVSQAENGSDEAIEIDWINADAAMMETTETADARRARTQGVIETFYTASANQFQSNRAGLNFAVASPVNAQLDLIFAGQFGAVERFETTARLRAGASHRVSATVGGMRVPLARSAKTSAALPSIADHAVGRVDDALGQFSVRAVDEWVVRDGVVVVLGLDYSRFLGAGNADSVSPRFGFQFDAGARTRLRAAYAPGGGDAAASALGSAFLEGTPVVFREPAEQPLALVDGRAVMERSRRFEFGVERVLDDKSSVEATAFFDTVEDRGIGLFSTPLNGFAGEPGAALSEVAHQQGAAHGMRVVYVRRLNRFLKASGGYSFGRGQQLASSPSMPSDPEQIFQNGFFQTVAAQVDADVADGTSVRTVLRFSPRAAVFAIDPFAGRLAVYDPSLSILVTHALPNFGLPVRAEAVLDARNLLDVMTSVEDGEKLTSLGALRRTVRGGISVKF